MDLDDDQKIDAYNKVATMLHALKKLGPCIHEATYLLADSKITETRRKAAIKNIETICSILKNTIEGIMHLLQDLAPVPNLTYAQSQIRQEAALMEQLRKENTDSSAVQLGDGKRSPLSSVLQEIYETVNKTIVPTQATNKKKNPYPLRLPFHLREEMSIPLLWLSHHSLCWRWNGNRRG